MTLYFNEGVIQRRLNPNFVLGASVLVTPDDVDKLICDLSEPFNGEVVGYQYSDHIRVLNPATDKEHIFNVNQIELANQ